LAQGVRKQNSARSHCTLAKAGTPKKKGDSPMKWTQQEKDYLKDNPNKSISELANELGRSYDSVRKMLKNMRTIPVSEQIVQDRKLLISKTEQRITDKKYQEALKEIARLKADQEAILQIKETPQAYTFTKRQNGGSDATAFIIASDWHIEERVRSSDTSGLNEFNLTIAKERVNRFFPNALKLIQISQKNSRINNAVLALLGDFISGSIYEELVENNQLKPAEAVWLVQNYLIGGIQFLLDNSDVSLTIVCHGGNHGRMTKKVHHATEDGNSLEVYMYRNIANMFASNPRVKFIIAEGYHTYLTAYDFTVRLHHGHNLKYGGGVGGIFIPVNKAIAQWNKGRRADLDVFGHFHQFKDGGNFICNGSLIGYNAFALSIKADYEKPQQAFFLIDKKHGKSIVAPIWLTS
jgi:molybdenum-dependent DNA-binding transcriptional regulator ModE